MRPQATFERISGCNKPAAICPWAGFPLPAVPRNPSPDFATGLIAAKPLKPCDGGVFGALNSLSKKGVKGAKAGRELRLGALAVAGLGGLELGLGLD